MSGLLCLSQGCVEAPRGPMDLSVALSEPMIARPGCYLFGRSLVGRQGVLDGLLEIHLPPLSPRLLEGCGAQP